MRISVRGLVFDSAKEVISVDMTDEELETRINAPENANILNCYPTGTAEDEIQRSADRLARE